MSKHKTQIRDRIAFRTVLACLCLMLPAGLLSQQGDSTAAGIGSFLEHAPVGTAVTVPVGIDVKATPLGGYDFFLNYDATTLEVTGVQGGTALEFSAQPFLDSRNLAKGSLRFGAFQGESFVAPTGDLEIARVRFRIVGHPRSTAAIDLANNLALSVDRIPYRTAVADGEIQIGNFLGDVNTDDSTNTISDVVVYVNHLTGTQDFTEIELQASDVNQDGVTATLADVIFMINIILGSQPSLLVDINTASETPVETNGHAEISIAPLQFDEQGQAQIPIRLKSDIAIGGILLRFNYDTAQIRIGEPALSAYAKEMNLMQHNLDTEYRIILVNLSGKKLGAGEGMLFTLPVTSIVEHNLNPEAIALEEAVVADALGAFVPVDLLVTDVEPDENDSVPQAFSMDQNYPNPFNITTSISFSIPATGSGGTRPKVALSIYNIQGQLVRTLIEEAKSPGFYTVTWDGEDEEGRVVSSGVYIYRLQAEQFGTLDRRLILLK